MYADVFKGNITRISLLLCQVLMLDFTRTRTLVYEVSFPCEETCGNKVLPPYLSLSFLLQFCGADEE